MMTLTTMDYTHSVSPFRSDLNKIEYDIALNNLARRATDGIIILTASPAAILCSLMKHCIEAKKTDLQSKKHKSNTKNIVKWLASHLVVATNLTTQQHSAAKTFEEYCNEKELKYIKISKDDVLEQPEKTLETVLQHLNINDANITTELLPIRIPEKRRNSISFRKSTSDKETLSTAHYDLSYPDAWTSRQNMEAQTIRTTDTSRAKTVEALQNKTIEQFEELFNLLAKEDGYEASKGEAIKIIKETYSELASKEFLALKQKARKPFQILVSMPMQDLVVP